MAATGLQFNWKTVKHGNTTISLVTDVQFDSSGKEVEFHSDDSPYPQCVAISEITDKISVKCGSESTILGLAIGTVATFTATHVDAKHATGGDIIYTVVNALITKRKTGGGYGKFGDASLDMSAYSADGVTSPLSFALG